MNRKLLVVEDERLLLMATADLVEAALQSPQGAQRGRDLCVPDHPAAVDIESGRRLRERSGR
jgi:hypothetical protein